MRRHNETGTPIPIKTNMYKADGGTWLILFLIRRPVRGGIHVHDVSVADGGRSVEGTYHDGEISTKKGARGEGLLGWTR